MDVPKNVATVILATGSRHEITEEIYEQILQMSDNDYVLLDDMTSFKKSAVMEIEPIKQVDHNYPQLPAKGYEGVIKSAKTGSHLRALATGLKKARARIKGIDSLKKSTPEIDRLLDLARNCYKGIKTNGYQPQFVTDENSTGYEKAKVAGVI